MSNTATDRLNPTGTLSRRLPWIAFLGLASVPLLLLGMQSIDPPGKKMAAAADHFLQGLNDQQREQATLPFGSEQRVQWHFIPKPTRKGLPLREMDDASRTAALRLVRAALSQSGYEKSRQIMMLEGVLLELEGPKSKGKRDPNKYYVTIFAGDLSQPGVSHQSIDAAVVDLHQLTQHRSLDFRHAAVRQSHVFGFIRLCFARKTYFRGRLLGDNRD
ncbi:MAG: DUF3500 domain-containing protein, partial [Planctomycetota bacterium]